MSRGIIAHQRHKLVGLETTWVRIFFLVLTRCVMLGTNHISLFLTSDHTNVLFPSLAPVKESLPQQGLDPKLLCETRLLQAWEGPQHPQASAVRQFSPPACLPFPQGLPTRAFGFTQQGPGRGPWVRPASLWRLSPEDLVWYFFSPSGIWPHSRAAYHEQSCLLAICRVARGKGRALTIQSLLWGWGAAYGRSCGLFPF